MSDITIEDVLDGIVGNCYDNRIFIRECVEYYLNNHPNELKQLIDNLGE